MSIRSQPPLKPCLEGEVRDERMCGIQTNPKEGLQFNVSHLPVDICRTMWKVVHRQEIVVWNLCYVDAGYYKFLWFRLSGSFETISGNDSYARRLQAFETMPAIPNAKLRQLSGIILSAPAYNADEDVHRYMVQPDIDVFDFSMAMTDALFPSFGDYSLCNRRAAAALVPMIEALSIPVCQYDRLMNCLDNGQVVLPNLKTVYVTYTNTKQIDLGEGSDIPEAAKHELPRVQAIANSGLTTYQVRKRDVRWIDSDTYAWWAHRLRFARKRPRLTCVCICLFARHTPQGLRPLALFHVLSGRDIYEAPTFHVYDPIVDLEKCRFLGM
ncbi:hypothetical protein ONZ43_g524 [Nemania bipapillata]|uniref:Uncharacterized protein n=1 Tax=Nemania bipapillata TaxID=110536 RepID=A0ACC2J889_9PEZI|nr:hypothetical protein ONZ43_g524 [Nemania bipapillata]